MSSRIRSHVDILREPLPTRLLSHLSGWSPSPSSRPAKDLPAAFCPDMWPSHFTSCHLLLSLRFLTEFLVVPPTHRASSHLLAALCASTRQPPPWHVPCASPRQHLSCWVSTACSHLCNHDLTVSSIRRGMYPSSSLFPDEPHIELRSWHLVDTQKIFVEVYA